MILRENPAKQCYKIKGKSALKGTKTELAGKVGETLAEKAMAAGISKVVFDRGGV